MKLRNSELVSSLSLPPHLSCGAGVMRGVYVVSDDACL